MAPSSTPSGEPRTLLRDQIFKELFDSIANGSLAPGEVLNDAELASKLGASKAPVREALQQLREIGFVEVVPNRYTRVSEVDPAHLLKCVNTIFVYYELAAQIGAPALQGTFEKIDEIMERLRRAGRDNDRPAFGVTLYQYFHTLAEAAGNVVLVRSMERLAPHLQRTLSPQPGLIQPENILKSIEHAHQQVHAGDGEAAAAEIHDLAAESRQYYLTTLSA